MNISKAIADGTLVILEIPGPGYPLDAENLRSSLETLTDLYGSLYHGFGDGTIGHDEFPDSRSHLDTMREWAKEFDTLHALTVWDGQYMEMIDDFFAAKLLAWRHSAPHF